MLTVACHCGAVRVEVEAAPLYLNECGCSICRRYGVRWGYYTTDEVRVVAGGDGTQAYAWGDMELDFHRCRRCGCVTHWTCRDPSEPRVGVNGRLFEPGDVEGVEVRRSAGPKE